MKALNTMVIAVAALACSGMAQAQFAKPEDAIKYRKNAMFLTAQHFGRVAAMASGKAPFDAKLAADNAAIAEQLGKLPWAAFGEGTDQGETGAKPEIWKDKARFDDLAQKMQGEMGKLVAATKTGDVGNIKTAVQGVGGSCKACHDDFRKR